MKFRVTFKTPSAIADVVKRESSTHSESEVEGLNYAAEMYAATAKFVSYGECITIEFDTETGTAVVVPRGPVSRGA